MLLPLFDVPSTVPALAPPPRPRFVATTSRTAYEELRPKLPAREAFVLEGLRAYERTRGHQPTAYELIEFLTASLPGKRIDANTVRPRLTALANEKRTRKDGRTYVVKVARRRCRVTEKTAWTWRVL